MEHKRVLWLVGLGVASWLIPFLVSVPLYAPGGGALIGIFLAKSNLIVVGAGVGTLLILVFLQGVHAGYLREGLLLGGAWLAINWALDAVVLLPLSGMGAVECMEQIGLRYLVIPIIAAGIGYGADRAVQTHGTDPGSVMF
ncbi:MAG: hypothetical protein ACP5C4_04195 [Methanomicrobiales archaeon]